MCVFTVYIYYVYINISDFKVNALTQIHFNGTHFINARLTQHEFSVWPVAQPIIGEMEMHSVANLVTLQTLLATFFPFKKASKPYLVWESPSTAAWVRGLAFTARTHTHTPLSLSLSLSFSASVQFLFSAQQPAKKSSALIQLNIDIILLASLILHDASRAEITAQAIVIILCVFDFIKLRLNYQGFCAD